MIVTGLTDSRCDNCPSSGFAYAQDFFYKLMCNIASFVAAAEIVCDHVLSNLHLPRSFVVSVSVTGALQID